MRRSLADPLHLEGLRDLEWQPPTLGQLSTVERACYVEQVKAAIAILDRGLKFASEDHVKGCLKYMAYGMAHKDATQTDWKFRTRVYMHALAEMPADIWTATAKELVVTAEWWPPVAKLAKIMYPALEQRKRMLARARQILASLQPSTTPQLKDQREKETPASRCRDIIAIYRKRGKMADAARVERDLAAMEQRDVEDWAKPQTVHRPMMPQRSETTGRVEAQVFDVEELPPLDEAHR